MTYRLVRATFRLLLCIVGISATTLYAQEESCYERYLREHNKEILPTIDESDDSYDELKKEVIARQVLRGETPYAQYIADRYDQPAPMTSVQEQFLHRPVILAIDTTTGVCHLLAEDGTVLADAHIAMVDSTWYMWLSVDPLADKNPSNSPYVYCNGNPIMFIDLDGMMPDDSEAAAMAAYAYGDADRETMVKIKNQLGDWKPIGDPHEFSGYRAVLFGRDVDSKTEYTYAFAGTDSHSVSDIVSDIAQATDFPSQYEMAIAMARVIAIKYKGKDLTFVGHSLGGGEATAAAMATGKKAITFNPAAVSLSTVIRNLLVFPASIENHVVDGDPLTIGQKYGNPLLVNVLKRSGLIILPGKTTIVPQVAGNAHTIDNFLK